MVFSFNIYNSTLVLYVNSFPGMQIHVHSSKPYMTLMQHIRNKHFPKIPFQKSRFSYKHCPVSRAVEDDSLEVKSESYNS